MTKIAVTFALALALHLLLGWGWTVAAGLVGGAWAWRRGWLVGAAGVGLDFLVLALYSYFVAPQESRIMLESVGELFGGIGLWVGVVTVLLGIVLGGVGGALGASLRILVAVPRTPAVE